MIKTIVVSGFPGIGKSHLFCENSSLVILDSDSSLFSWTSPGVRNPDFPQNYIEHIKTNIGKAHIILVSSHKAVRDVLRANEIKYVLVYPNKDLKFEYMNRYAERGSDDGFIRALSANWWSFINEIEAEEYPTKIKLQSGEYLSDVVNRLVYPVMCEGICNSDSDDYCGMHMSYETCPACDALSNKKT